MVKKRRSVLPIYGRNGTHERTSPAQTLACPGQQGDRRDHSNGDGNLKATATRPEHDDKDGVQSDCDSTFNWREGELERLLSPPLLSETGEPTPSLVILAADVIYDEGLTEAFFDVLKLLMPPPPPPPPPPLPPSNGDDGDQAHHDSASREANGGGMRGTATKESSQERSRCPLPSTPSVDDVSAHTEPPSSPWRRQQRQGFAGYVAPANTSNVGVETDSKEDPGRKEPPPSGGQMLSSFIAGGVGETVVLYLALEKRFNFSLAELSVSATGYKALLGNVVDVTDAADGRGIGDGCASRRKAFEGIRLPLKFQQCFRYNRSDAMEIWEIRRRPVY